MTFHMLILTSYVKKFIMDNPTTELSILNSNFLQSLPGTSNFFQTWLPTNFLQNLLPTSNFIIASPPSIPYYCSPALGPAQELHNEARSAELTEGMEIKSFLHVFLLCGYIEHVYIYLHIPFYSL